MSATRRPYFWITKVCVSLMMIGVAPVFSLFLALGLASALGCSLSEGGPLPCPVLGVDAGDALIVMAIMGMFAVYTLPVAAIAFAVWLVARMWRRRQQRRHPA